MERNSKRKHAVQRVVTNNVLLFEVMSKRTSFSYKFENKQKYLTYLFVLLGLP